MQQHMLCVFVDDGAVTDAEIKIKNVLFSKKVLFSNNSGNRKRNL